MIVDLNYIQSRKEKTIVNLNYIITSAFGHMYI